LIAAAFAHIPREAGIAQAVSGLFSVCILSVLSSAIRGSPGKQHDLKRTA
jgi:hypothetical protein